MNEEGKAHDSDESVADGGQHSPVESTAPNPAASMSLLQTVLDSALDPGYRKSAVEKHKKQKLWRKILTFILAVVLMFITTVAVKNLRFNESKESQIHSNLVDQVEDRQNSVSTLSDSVEFLNKEIRDANSEVETDVVMEEYVVINSAASSVSGPGVLVSVEDSEALQAQGKGLVRDVDLRLITNILWESGAEAISVGNIRLGAETTIRTAGSAILVDLEPISSPYEIRAVGDANRMLEALSSGETGQQLKDQSALVGFGVNVKRESNLNLPGLELFQPEWIVNSDETQSADANATVDDGEEG